MKTIGRNDPCPCGSGKKYKKCCGAVSRVGDSDFQYANIRRLDGESGNLLMRFAKQRYGENALENAWGEFFFSDEIPYDMSHPEFDFFLRWFTFDWRPQENETLAELFLSQKVRKTGGDVDHFIHATLDSPYSFWQILETEPGTGMTLRDVLRKREVKVTEHSASLILERGHIVYARVVEMDGMFFMMGTGTRVIPPSFLDRLLDLRETIESERPTFDGCIAAETLLDLEDELREEYLVIADVLGNQKLHVSNTDGDPLALTTLTYDIPSLGEAFHALKDLEQKATGRNDSDLLAEAERNATGELEKVYIHWLKPRKKSENNDATLLATLVITPSTLVVEVNSEKRSKQIRKEITKRLGEKAVLLRTEITSHEGVLKKAAKSRKGAKPDEESEHDRIMRESPEARALMKQMMEKHWSSWPDIPLPALRGMTPRQASRDPRGRELLESLLMDFESRNRSEKDEFLRVDITRIRRDLGLETS